MSLEKLNDFNFQIALKYFRDNLDSTQATISKIKEFCLDNAKFSLDKWLENYIHMFINRLFITNQNTHEIVIYDFLARYYESVVARKIYN